LQEHILYIGHPDFFNIKGLASFTFNLKHVAGTAANIAPLNIKWEYWGESGNPQDEEDGWQHLELEDDTTNALSANGCFILKKTAEGEIKEREINNVTSRWIRGRLEEPLPVSEPRKLPVLDNIQFKVESEASELLPDLAFHNDTPLDIALDFFPFGTEPRLFDRFNIASQEAFSKASSEITLNVKLDSRLILAAPAAVQDGTNIRVFARGTAGRLLEFNVNADAPADIVAPMDHGFPTDTKIALPDRESGTEARPAVANYNDDTFGVFIRAENGHIFELFLRKSEGISEWFDHGKPEDNEVRLADIKDMLLQVFAFKQMEINFLADWSPRVVIVGKRVFHLNN